jgi:hypothetical protein
MSETYKLVDGEYESKEVAKVEVTETKEPVVVVADTTAKNLQETIDLLNERKQQATDRFDEEIKINQDRLDAIQPIIEEAKIKEPIKEGEPTGDTGYTGYTV